MSNKKLAFTLAEILITLAIIGVIASLTIPSLVNNINDQQNKIVWKKTYAELSQAHVKLLIDTGGNLGSIFNGGDSVKDKYIGYLSYIKSCNSQYTQGNCWNTYGGKNLTTGVITPVSTWWDYAFTSFGGIVLNNGVMLLFEDHGSFTCTGTGEYHSECAKIFVDVNGFKEPNRWGKDIFGMYILPDRLLPFGQTNTHDSYSECIGGNGMGCAAPFLYQ